jgi:hypothetical protein
MLIQKSFKGLAATLVILGSAGVAVAGGPEKRQSYPSEISNYSANAGLYIEGSAGYAFRHWLSDSNFFSGLDTDNTLANSSNGNGGFVGGLDAGYQFNKNFSVEAGWLYLPTTRFVDKPEAGNIADKYRITSNVGYADAKGSIPILAATAIFGKIGAAYTWNNSSADIPVSEGSDKVSTSSHWSPLFAAGIQHYFTPNCSLSVQYTYIPGDRLIANNHFLTPDTQLVTASLGYKFLV